MPRVLSIVSTGYSQLLSTMSHRVVLITGCSSGIGLATAVMLAKDQQKRYRVYATMRNLDKRGSLETAAQGYLNDTLFVRELDVTSDESVASLLQSIYTERERIDVLINNAGIGLMGILETHPQQLIKNVFDTNFFGVLRLTKSVLPKMKFNRDGHIINISSAEGVNAVPFYSIYSSSKYAVEGMSESLAPLLKKFNVKLSIIESGPVSTSFPSRMLDIDSADDGFEGVDEETKQLLSNVIEKQKSALPNISQSPDEIARFIMDVLHEDNPHLRYQTSKTLATAVADKLHDSTGDKPADIMYQRFFS